MAPTSSRFRLRTLWLGAVLACCVDVTTASAQLQFDAWTIANGLPQGSINDIAQTPDGYLWLATYGGLVRFDGVRFVVFDLTTEGIGTLRTRTLLVARDGTLWVGSDDARIIRYRDGRFETFDDRAGMPAGAVLRLDEGADGQIWATLTYPHRILRFDGHTFVGYRPGDLPHSVAPHEPASGRVGAYALWWSLDADGVHCLVAGTVDLCLAATDLPSEDVRGVVTEQDGTIWILTEETAIPVRDGRVVRDRLRPGPQDRLPYGAILHSDRRGRLWLSRSNYGLSVIGPGGSEPVLSTTTVLSIFGDRDGHVWVGTTNGLRRAVEPTVTSWTTRDGLASNNINPILETRAGEVWVGTWGGGVNRIAHGQVATYRAGADYQSQQITSLFEDRNGHLLVGTSAGLRELTGEGLRPYPGASRWLGGRTWAIAQDQAGALWFGTDDGLVVEHDGGYVRYTTADGLPDNGISALYFDRADRLWVGTRRGLAMFQDGAATATYTVEDGLIGSIVRALHEDESGVLWIGTYDGGLYRLEAGHLTRFTRKTGLYDNGVFQILDDLRGNFWMCSNRGIFRVRRADLDDYAHGRRGSVSAIGLGVRDGMANAECNGGRQPGGIRRADGTLWFPTQGGIAVVDPAAIELDDAPPTTIIEDAALRGVPVALSGPVRVPPERNSLEIRYTAPVFVHADQTRFRFRLVGLDDAWTEAGTRRTVSYEQLPPGAYTFEVQAVSASGAWSDTPARLALVVLAPFWRQGWFLLCAASGALVVVGLIVRGRLRRLRRDRDAQRALSRRLLAVQEHERRRISQEMHDSLGQDLFMIKARARAGREAAADAATRDAFEALGTLAGQSYEGMKQLAYSLRPFQLDKIGLARTVDSLVTRMADAASLPIEVDVAALDAGWSAESAIHVYRIVQEAMHNLLRHADATAARVVARRRRAAVELRIEDNGRGFGGARPSGTGFGVMTMYERAVSLGGSLTFESTPESGTAVVLLLPVPGAAGT